jgi:hypothetical protein
VVVVAVGFQLPHCLVALVAVLDVEAIQLQAQLLGKDLLAVLVTQAVAVVEAVAVVALARLELQP